MKVVVKDISEKMRFSRSGYDYTSILVMSSLAGQDSMVMT